MEKDLDSTFLLPASSAHYIANNAQYVKIAESGIDKLCDDMLKNVKENKLVPPDTGAEAIHPSKDHTRATDWVFVADTLNFCFWSYSGEPKWTVDGYCGYYALEAALHRAIKEGHDITNPEYYSKITAEQLKNILRSDNEAQVPLFEERLSVLHEVGEVLLKKFNGTFETCINLAGKSALRLLEIIVENFPCFRDESVYEGKRVVFYKRAQILVADLWYFFNGTEAGELLGLQKLTMFADYRVPQVLVYFDVLQYTNELMEKLKKDELLPSGSKEEVEIRGCTIHAVELLRERLQQKMTAKGQNVTAPNSCEIDYYLWCYRRHYAEQLEKIPFHKTLGIFY